MEVSRDPIENKRQRLKILNRCRVDPKFRGVVFEKCRRDKIYWNNLFAWTLDPRLGSSTIPFILYPRQEDIFNKLDELLERSRKGEQVAIFFDKPRGVGLTVTVMNWLLHHLIFDESFNALIGSRKEDLVDKSGNVDSLFYKLDYTMSRLPTWMKSFENPANHKFTCYSERENRSSMSMRIPFSDKSIDGDSSSPNFGRGGRRTVVVMDEHDFWEDAASAWGSCGASTNFRISITTPSRSGRDSFCYKLKNQKEGKIEVFPLEWSDVPSRDEKWLNDMKNAWSEEVFSREVMKSYEGTTEGKVYASDIKSSKIEVCQYRPDLPLYCTWDDGLDTTALIWCQKDFKTGQIFFIDCYERDGKEISFFAPFCGYPIDSKFEYNDFELRKIEEHKYWQKAIHYGDPSIAQTRNNINKSCWDILQENFGINVQTNGWAKKGEGNRTWKDLRDIARTKFRRCSFDPQNCEKLIYALRNSRMPSVKDGSNSTSAPTKPVHDSLSHFRSAFEYFCDHESELSPYFDDEDESDIYQEERFDKFSIF